MVSKSAISKNILSMASNSGRPKTPCRNTSVRLPKCCGRATLPPASPLNDTDLSHKNPVISYLDLPQMRQMRHIGDTKMRFQLRRVSHSYPSQIRFLPMPWYTLRPKRDTKSHPIHRLHAGPNGLDPTTSQYHRHQLRKREFVCQPLTKAKLTRSCAGPNSGAIKYLQFITDIALEETERCKKLALEHHKCHKMRTSKASNASCHAKTSGKEARVSREVWSLPRT